MELTKVTLTGIDEKTDLKKVAKLSKDYPFVEWAVLFSKTKCGLENRYPSIKKIDEFANLSIFRAMHLCGSIARKYAKQNYYDIYVREDRPMDVMFSNIFKPFDRYQFNISNLNIDEVNFDVFNISSINTIVQINNFSWFEKLENTDVLFDISGGRGQEISIDDIIVAPFNGFNFTKINYLGFAGGLGPDNVVAKTNSILDNFSEIERGIWIDMESKIRTDDWLDLDKCEDVLRKSKRIIK